MIHTDKTMLIGELAESFLPKEADISKFDDKIKTEITIISDFLKGQIAFMDVLVPEDFREIKGFTNKPILGESGFIYEDIDFLGLKNADDERIDENIAILKRDMQTIGKIRSKVEEYKTKLKQTVEEVFKCSKKQKRRLPDLYTGVDNSVLALKKAENFAISCQEWLECAKGHKILAAEIKEIENAFAEVGIEAKDIESEVKNHNSPIVKAFKFKNSDKITEYTKRKEFFSKNTDFLQYSPEQCLWTGGYDKYNRLFLGSLDSIWHYQGRITKIQHIVGKDDNSEAERYYYDGKRTIVDYEKALDLMGKTNPDNKHALATQVLRQKQWYLDQKAEKKQKEKK